MFPQVFDGDIANFALVSLDAWKVVRSLPATLFPDPVQVDCPSDSVHVFEVSVNGVPIVLDHPTANLALEGGGLNLAPPVRVFVLLPLDVVLGLDVSVKGAIVRETLWTQGALVGRARTLQRIQEILQLKAGFYLHFYLFTIRKHIRFFSSSNPNF